MPAPRVIIGSPVVNFALAQLNANGVDLPGDSLPIRVGTDNIHLLDADTERRVDQAR